MNEVIHISGNHERIKMADHILEMAGLGWFCNYYFFKKIATNQVTNVECRKLFLNSKLALNTMVSVEVKISINW